MGPPAPENFPCKSLVDMVNCRHGHSYVGSRATRPTTAGILDASWFATSAAPETSNVLP